MTDDVEDTLVITVDDDALSVIDMVNTKLEPYGIAFVDDGLVHDGFCVFNMVEVEAGDKGDDVT